MSTLFDLSAVLRLDTSNYEEGIARARKSGEQWARSTETHVGGALKKAQQGFTVFKGVLSNLVSSGINMLASAIRDNLGGAISRVDTLNNYTKVMVNLGYTAKESDAAIKQLSDGIDGLPTTLPAIASLQQQFAALNGDMEKSTKLSLALNDATLAGGQGQEMANSAMNQWYQIIANGKPDLQSWRIINMAMPAQLKQISQELLGTKASAEDLRTAWMDGTVTTEQVTDALIKLDQKGGKGIAKFSEQAKSATGGIQTSMTNIKTAIQKGLADVIENGIGGENIAKVFNELKVGIKNAFSGVTQFINNVKDIGLSKALVKEIENARKLFAKFADNVDIPSAIRKLANIIVKEGPAVLDAMGKLLNDLGAWLAENGADALIELGIGFVKALPMLISYFGQVINALLKAVVGLPVMLLARGLEAGGAFALGILKKANAVATAGAKLVSNFVKGLRNLVGRARTAAGNAVSALVSRIASGAGKIKATAQKLAHNAVSAVKNGFASIGSVGLNLVRGIWSGISNGTNWIKSRIKSWVGNVKNFLKNLFGIKSPSKWARDEIGKMIDAGLALGISNNSDMVDDALEDVVPDVSKGLISRSSTSNNSRIISPIINMNTVVNGADDPEMWGDKMADEFIMRVRTA